MPDALTLWDCLFACDANLDLAQWVCVAMLIRIRNECAPSRSLLDGCYVYPILSNTLRLQRSTNNATTISLPVALK